MLISDKKINFILLFSTVFFVLSCIFFLQNKTKATFGGRTQSGVQVGGRISAIMPPSSCGAPPLAPCPHLCVTGMMDVFIMPYGYSTTGLCMSPAGMVNLFAYEPGDKSFSIAMSTDSLSNKLAFGASRPPTPIVLSSQNISYEILGLFSVVTPTAVPLGPISIMQPRGY